MSKERLTAHIGKEEKKVRNSRLFLANSPPEGGNHQRKSEQDGAAPGKEKAVYYPIQKITRGVQKTVQALIFSTGRERKGFPLIVPHDESIERKVRTTTISEGGKKGA